MPPSQSPSPPERENKHKVQDSSGSFGDDYLKPEDHKLERHESDDSDLDSAYGSYSTSPSRQRPRERQRSGSSLPPLLRHASVADEYDAHPPPTPLVEDGPVSWAELPRKDQLIIIILARLSEPLAQTSLTAYMYFMLKSFDADATDEQVSTQAGYLTGAFTFAQCLTAVMWGRLADKASVGRKNVVILGLFGTMVSVLGFGFSRSFAMAMCFRCLGGALNGNIGILRTMTSEIYTEKKYQPKAFLAMPITFNIGVLIGPVLGGWLQNPVETFPGIFGPGSRLGGEDGVAWMIEYPYALPNLVTAAFLFASTLLAYFALEETHRERRHLPDYGRKIGLWVAHTVWPWGQRSGNSQNYERVDDQNGEDVELMADTDANPDTSPTIIRILPYRRIFTRNLCVTMMAHGMLAMHLGAFYNMWFLFLSTPRFDPANPDPPSHTTQSFPFFTGGLGLPPPTIGFAIGILGILGLSMQFGVYSWITYKLGTVPAYRWSLLAFPLTYSLAPFLALLPTTKPSPAPASGVIFWLGISVLLFIQVTGRTFALPITQILVNNCCPHPSVLSSVHGIGQSVSAGARTLGPILWSTLYGIGLEKGIVGLAWWTLAIEALCLCAASLLLTEGDGHEIKLEGEE